MTLASSKLGDYLLPVKSANPISLFGSCDFAYVDISSVDRVQRAIANPHLIAANTAPSRARQVVEEDDVIVSTVRPNLNTVAVVTKTHAGAIASTGFSVLRATPGKLDGRFLFHWISCGSTVNQLVSLATGANYPAVSDKIIKSLPFCPPSLLEQQRIAAILDRADSICRKRQDAVYLVNELLRAVFIDMFGDPVANPKRWQVKRLADLGNLDRGISKHRPRNDPSLLGGPHPLIQTGEVANCDGYIRGYTSTYSEKGLHQSKLWPAGTLCITIAANIAKTGILLFPACFPDSVVGFTAPENATVEYVRFWLSFLQKTLEANAPESAQKNINLAILRELQVPVPPTDLVRRFAAVVSATESIRVAQRRSASESQVLLESLQHELLA